MLRGLRERAARGYFGLRDTARTCEARACEWRGGRAGAGQAAGAGAVAGAGAGHGAGMGVVDAGAPALAKTWASSPVAPPLFLYLVGLA